VRLEPGPVTTAGRIVVEGEPRLSRPVILRHLAIEPGDTILPGSLDRGQRMLQSLDLVSTALLSLSPGSTPGTADVEVRLREGNPRVVSGRAGYADDEGILAEGRLEHRDFLGGGRVLRLATTATTGIGSLADFARRNFGASISLIQPHIGAPELRLVSTLYGYRDNGQRELAEELGGEVTLVYAPGPDRFVSAGYSVSTRDVLENRGIGGASLDLFELLELQESLEGRITQTALTLAGSWGERDDVTYPTRGWLVGGSVDLNGVDPWATNQFVRAELAVSGLRTVLDGRLKLLARARAGRLWPFGRSRTSGDNAAAAYLRLSDAVFTAGGTGTVRGWQAGLLGPKFPGIEVDADAGVLIPADRWVPLGGLSRWVASLEAQTPLPGLGGGPYALAFVDAGRVWTPDSFFTADEDLPLRVDDSSYAGVGAGIGIPTLVGPIRIMVGYKLNPGSLDLRDSDRILEEFLEGDGDLAAVPRNPWRRWRLHFSIGQPF
jgi:outer membrane protein assembly factor BamA